MSRYQRRRLRSAAIAFGDTTKTICEIPAGGIVLNAWVVVSTAFNAGTTNVLIVGHAADDDAYIAAADVTEGTPGVYPAAPKGPFAPEAAKRVVSVKYTQTGDAATTGAATAFVEYVS